MSSFPSNDGVLRSVSADTSLRQPPAPNSNRVEFLDLKAQFASIRADVMTAITRVMESQYFILGSEVESLEKEIAALLGVAHAVSCASGTDALTLALMASEIGPGDEVITTPFTFIATAGSIARVGARPVFVDIDPETFNIDVNRIPSAITSRTRAILPVHLFGLPAELDRIVELASDRGLAVIEDAAQAIGARYRDRNVGAIGTAGCFSFFPSKNLGGAGDGGLVSTNNDALADRLRLLRVHGARKKYHYEILGANSRLDSLQAAILRVKLGHLNEWTHERQLRADRYRRLFEEMGLSRFVKVPSSPPSDSVHVYNQFTIRTHEREGLRNHLRESGITAEIYYPSPLHLQPAFEYLGYRTGQFPHSELASREVLSLPIYPELKQSQQDGIAGSIRDFYARSR